MKEIKKIYHKKTGEIVFEDIEGQWWRFDYYFTDISAGNFGSWEPLAATEIDNPINE